MNGKKAISYLYSGVIDRNRGGGVNWIHHGLGLIDCWVRDIEGLDDGKRFSADEEARERHTFTDAFSGFCNWSALWVLHGCSGTN